MRPLILLIILLFNQTAIANVAEQCQNNTVIVTDGKSHGSGVLFSRDEVTFVWTVGHVADQFMKPNGSFNLATIVQGDEEARAKVLRASDYEIIHDIALLQITSGTIFHGDAEFYRAFNHVKVGQSIIHVGTPGIPIAPTFHELSVFIGNISYINRNFNLFTVAKPRFVDQINVTSGHGCSGGGVFDAKTGDILGFVSLGTVCGVSFTVPTRYIYEFAKSHDCLWAFDREVPLPNEIIPWRGDKYNRLISMRNNSEIDKRWG